MAPKAFSVADVFRIVALCTATFLWATAFWFFCIAPVSMIHGAREKKAMGFHLMW